MIDTSTLSGNYHITIGAYIRDEYVTTHTEYRHVESRAEQDKADIWTIFTLELTDDGETICEGPYECEFKGPKAAERAVAFGHGLAMATGWDFDDVGGCY